MPAYIPPATYSVEELDILAKRHGGISDRRSIMPKSPGKDEFGNPLPAPIGGPTTVFVFKDGSTITVSFNNDDGKWWTVDPGTVADVEADTAKAKAATTDTRRPDQVESDRLSLEQQRVNLAKSQQAAQPDPGKMQSAFEDASKTIDYIEAQIAANKMKPTDGYKLMAQVKQSIQDMMTGSTAAGRAKSAADYRQNNAQLGGSMLNQRVSSGTSMANNLAQGAQEAYGRMLPYTGKGEDPALQFNPWRMAEKFVTRLGGGQQTYDAAARMVQGAQGQGENDPSTPGYWLGTPENPGDPGAMDDQEAPGASPFTVPGLDAYNNPDVYLENRPRYAPSGSSYEPPYLGANDPSTWWGR